MVRCTNQGCGKEYEPSASGSAGENREDCMYHPGGPVFHEGLKSWSCCKETNKPVLEFDEFVKIAGCTRGEHSSTSKSQAPVPSQSQAAAKSAAEPSRVSANGVETYGQAAPAASSSSAKPAASGASKSSSPSAGPSSPAAATWTIPHDPPTARIPAGARCRRRGCGAIWSGEPDAERRSLPGAWSPPTSAASAEHVAPKEEWKVEVRATPAAGEEAGESGECAFHPGNPIFHEGSKGYLCCKRRVLDFDDFLNLPGCRRTSHLFLEPRVEAKSGQEEERVDCRMDHYQTPMQVHVSAFAKGADKERSAVKFEETSIHLDLYLPGNKRVVKTVELYGAIDAEKSAFRVLGTKVEITLQKPSATSWPLLAKPSSGNGSGAALPPGYALTFGVGGRTGTVGGKVMHVA